MISRISVQYQNLVYLTLRDINTETDLGTAELMLDVIEFLSSAMDDAKIQIM